MLNNISEVDFPFLIEDRSDKRGFSFSLKIDSLNNFHIVSIMPGKTRGNHKHNYNEVVILLGGKEKAEIEMGNDLCKKRIIVDNDFYPILFPASVRHVIRNIGNQVFYLVCFSY